MRCAVYGCNSDNGCKSFTSDIKFFSFPKDKELQAVWTRLCERGDKFNVKYARVCSKHFSDDDHERNLKHELLGYTPAKYRPLKKGAVPSQNLPKMSQKKSGSTGRTERQEKRQQKKLDNILKGVDVLNSNTSAGGSRNNFLGDDSLSTSSSCHTIPEQVLNESTQNVGAHADPNERDEIITKLKEKIAFLEKRQNLIGKLFSEEQLKKLEGSKTRLRWTVDDISKAIVIYSSGPRAYRLLLKKGYPFPAASCLRSWLKKVTIAPGILKNVFNFMKLSDMTSLDKLCVLSFDEIKIRKAYLYDKANDHTLKPYSYAQVVMLRGLFQNWKQPVFYDFDFPLSKEKLFEIIQFAEASGFQVVAMVSDLGGGNRALYKQLNISHTNTGFKNPANDQKIFVFADVPHLMKLLRNHFVDQGFILNDKEINKSIIEELIDVTSTSDLMITHKISKENLNVQGTGRQKVKLATKLFSHTIAMAITRCGTMGVLKQQHWIECAEFFKLVNDWFDIMNVRQYSIDTRDQRKAYGLVLDVQDPIVTKMTNTVENLRVKGRKGLLPFQKGIIMSNISLRLLLDDLKTRFSIKYLLTYRLNQDVLENFFGAIRAKGGLHDHPDALQFKYHLRSYILGRSEDSFSSFGNVEDDDTPNIPMDEINLCGKYFSAFQNRVVTSPEEPVVSSVESDLTHMEYDGLENLAGYVCHKLKEPNSSIASFQSSEYTWVSHLSEGGLSKPSAEFLGHIEELEKIFKSVNLDNLCISKNYLKHLVEISSFILCSDKAKMLFFRCRMYFRIRELNRELHNATLSRKRKLSKTIC